MFQAITRTLEEAIDLVVGRQVGDHHAVLRDVRGRFADRDHAIRVFEEHNAAVRREVPAGRLLEFEIGSTHGFAGFLGSQRNGRGTVFHITELD